MGMEFKFVFLAFYKLAICLETFQFSSSSTTSSNVVVLNTIFNVHKIIFYIWKFIKFKWNEIQNVIKFCAFNLFYILYRYGSSLTLSLPVIEDGYEKMLSWASISVMSFMLYLSLWPFWICSECVLFSRNIYLYGYDIDDLKSINL